MRKKRIRCQRERESEKNRKEDKKTAIKLHKEVTNRLERNNKGRDRQRQRE